MMWQSSVRESFFYFCQAIQQHHLTKQKQKSSSVNANLDPIHNFFFPPNSISMFLPFIFIISHLLRNVPFYYYIWYYYYFPSSLFIDDVRDITIRRKGKWFFVFSHFLFRPIGGTTLTFLLSDLSSSIFSDIILDVVKCKVSLFYDYCHSSSSTLISCRLY